MVTIYINERKVSTTRGSNVLFMAARDFDACSAEEELKNKTCLQEKNGAMARGFNDGSSLV